MGIHLLERRWVLEEKEQPVSFGSAGGLAVSVGNWRAESILQHRACDEGRAQAPHVMYNTARTSASRPRKAVTLVHGVYGQGSGEQCGWKLHGKFDSTASYLSSRAL